MGQRSLTAPLSQSEELTLRRIALGIVEIKDLPEQLVARLRAFGFIDDDSNGLTPTGQERYELLPRPNAKQTGRPNLERKLAALLEAAKQNTTGSKRR